MAATPTDPPLEGAPSPFVVHRVRWLALIRLIVVPPLFWAALSGGRLGLRVLALGKQPGFGAGLCIMCALLLVLALFICGSALYGGFTPAAISIGPEGLIRLERRRRTLWTWADIRDVRLVSTRGGSFVSFTDLRAGRRISLAGDWSVPGETIHRRIERALAGQFGPDERELADAASMQPGASRRTLVYLLIGAAPFVFAIVFAVILSAREMRRRENLLRLQGTVTDGVVEHIDVRLERGGPTFNVTYSFQARDPNNGRVHTYRDNLFISCSLYWRNRGRSAVSVVYVPTEAHISRLVLVGRYRRGLTTDAFQPIWRPAAQLSEPGCFALAPRS